ncbi:UV-stimulated scaffold protein A homolog isoform X2 [Ricinus communis]|uniref:UV-stimulated scaffold protein A homolog isoform X2 n=1 Tax=Ricinus communis TaxID=3988 RepID=UPI00077296ED|nr:UV-stimulated scaffold protein A homolog isoform X2 [Ricinus communis]|eukprot:XP_015577386.1 UV-stimulated scaffold protein A homolog isoform X2 [Ricinus communis]
MEENGRKVRALIEKATNSTAAEVDPRLLKAIKTIVRYSDSELRIAAQALMDLMKRDHSQVRKNLPLPAPPAVACVLRSKAIEFLEKWNSSFGIHYRQIRLGFDYLKNTLRFQFPNIQANAARLQQERKEREMRSKEILQNKFEKLKENLSLIKKEILSTIDELGECLEIVRSERQSMPLGPLDDDEDFEEFRPSELRQIRLDSLREGEKIHENTENKVVFDALRELYKLLVTKHLVSVQEWISVLIRVELADNRSRDSILKEFIDIQKRLQSVKKKCIDLGCVLPDTTKHEKEEEEDIWEEGKIVLTETESSGGVPNKLIGNSSTSGEVKNKAPASSEEEAKCNASQDREQAGTHSSSLRSNLLAEAPVVKWGSFLDNWGSITDIPANQRGLELESHWGRVDHDAVIPAEKIAELNIRATVYQEEQVEIQPCHAPLRKGGLCQRRDLRVCPFHGPIIPRDDEGNPINQSTSTDDTADNSELVEQLAKQAVKNIRDRDNEEAQKRKMDKQLQKRAKLAKIREHNEALLRDAALASTSNSAFVGDDFEATTGESLSARNKKESLASMLRKKETTKDRLAQRLLNSRTRDATIRQVTLGEDANYREAFPNQW